LQKLRISNRPPEDLPAGEIVETLLEETGTRDRLPTDESKLLGFLNLQQLSFDFAQEMDFLQKVPDLPSKLRAALSLNDKVVVTHSTLGPKRCRFSVFHEIGHFVLPEHREKLFLDTDETLGWWTKLRLEKEANEIAADFIFQGNRFTDESIAFPLSCRTVHQLAPKYAASYESALRRYVERHVLPCAAIVFNKISRDPEESDLEDSQYQIQYTIVSPSFAKDFFTAVESNEPFSRGSDIFKVHAARNVANIAEAELVVERANKGNWHFETELFTNGYKIFQFVVRPTTPHKK
jgi:Zn-dependent peptidase ImmA (M78 family)